MPRFGVLFQIRIVLLKIFKMLLILKWLRKRCTMYRKKRNRFCKTLREYYGRKVGNKEFKSDCNQNFFLCLSQIDK